MARDLPSDGSDWTGLRGPSGLAGFVPMRQPTVMPTLWIVHRDSDRRATLARLAGAGEDTILGHPADRLFEAAPPADVVLLGLAGDFEEELEFAHRYAPRLRGTLWILVAERPDVEDAQRLFDTLDADVIAFPPRGEGLRSRLRAMLSRRHVDPLSQRRARDAVAARFARFFSGLELPGVLRALDPRLARTPVLIRGEPGTGRSLLAHYLHAFGGSTGGELVKITCAPDVGPEALLARLQAAARRERARSSLTVLLAEVDRLSPAAQSELSDWIEFAPPAPVAHSTWLRWIATAQDPAELPARPLDAGLEQALGALCVRLPTLRESPERIEALVDETALAFCEVTGSRPRRFSEEALAVLRSHPWPGNFRELEGVVARTLAAVSAEVIDAGSLRFDFDLLLAEEPPPRLREETAAPVRRVPPEEPREEGTPESETWRIFDEQRATPREASRAPEPAEAWHEPTGTAEPSVAARPAGTPEPSVATRPAPQSLAFRTAPADLVGDSELRRFLGAVSHELGNSVVPLRAAAALLPERFNDPEFRERFGQIVQTDSRRIEEVLTRLSCFASFGAPSPGDVDLSALIDELIDEQRTELEARQILLLRELERDQPRVLGSAEQLRFAFDGLLRKALELVKLRGDLYLASRHHPSGLHGGPTIRVLLRFQASGRVTPAPGEEGVSLSETALDLLLTEAIVRAHGGTFTLDASDGAETVILIDLPAPPPARS